MEIQTEENLDIVCEACDSYLDGYQRDTNRSPRTIKITPCEGCIEKATQQGYDQGYDEAKNEYDGR